MKRTEINEKDGEWDAVNQGASLVLSDRASTGQLVKIIDETVNWDRPDSTEERWLYVLERLRAAENHVVAAGAMLIRLKHDIGHGNFLTEVERHGIPERAAQRYMKAASTVLRLRGIAREQALGWSTQKLLALSVLATEDLELIDEKSGPGGLSIAQIQVMPAKDLKAIVEREKRKAEHAEQEKCRLIEENHDLQKKLESALGRDTSKEESSQPDFQRVRDCRDTFDRLLDELRPDRFRDSPEAIQSLVREVVVLVRMRIATIEADWIRDKGPDSSPYLVPTEDVLPEVRTAAAQQQGKVAKLLSSGATADTIIERPRRVK